MLYENESLRRKLQSEYRENGELRELITLIKSTLRTEHKSTYLRLCSTIELKTKLGEKYANIETEI